MIELCPAGRAGTPDEVGSLGALLMGEEGTLIVLTRAPRFPHLTASAITRSELARLESWYARSGSAT